MLCGQHGQDHVINVFDRNNIAEVRDVIPLPGMHPTTIAACSISNCVYVCNVDLEEFSNSDSVLRITKTEKQLYTMSSWITDIQLKLRNISVSDHGSLITLSSYPGLASVYSFVRIYAANGFLQHGVLLFHREVGLSSVDNVILKSNGNFIFVSDNSRSLTDSPHQTKLVETDMFGVLIRRYQSQLGGEVSVYLADNYDRIIITSWHGTYELLDSELNRLAFTRLEPLEGQLCISSKLHINTERNEIMRIYGSLFTSTRILSIFRLIYE